MRYVSCYNCSGKEYSFYDKENGYTLVKCSNCGLLYVNPRPEDDKISEYKKTGIHEGDNSLNVIGKYSKKKKDIYLKLLPNIYPKDKFLDREYSWLDIGAGFGEFMEAIAIYTGERIKIEGIEPNTKKRESANIRNLRMYSMEKLKDHSKYDFISALNVFSHLPDPIETLSEWKKLIKPKGEILIETGDTANLSSNEHPKPYYLPDHLSFASIDIVKNILLKCGFEILSITSKRSSVFPELNPKNILREVYLVFSSGSIRNRFKFFHKNPNIDMWVRARRND